MKTLVRFRFIIYILILCMLTGQVKASVFGEPLLEACKANHPRKVIKEISRIENDQNYIDLLHLAYVYSIECKSLKAIDALIEYRKSKNEILINDYFAFAVACTEGFTQAAKWLIVNDINNFGYTENEISNLLYDEVEDILPYYTFQYESLSDYGLNTDGYFSIKDEGNLFGRHYTYLLHSKKNEYSIYGEPFYRLGNWSETYFNDITKKVEGFNYGWLHFIILKEGLDKFQLACLFNNLELAKFLYGSTDAVDSNKVIRAYFLACLRGNTEIIKWLIEQKGLDPLVDLFDENAFLYACKGNQMETAQWLFNYSPNINYIDASKCNAFMHSCKNGNIEMAKWLYSLGANISQTGEKYEFGFGDKFTAMDLAIKFGHTELVKWLNQLSVGGFREEIILAAGNGQLETLNFLYTKHTTTDSIYTYKYYLEWLKDIDTIRSLLKQDRVNLLGDKDKNGKTAFVAACENGHLHILKWLLSKGYNGEDDYKSNQYALLIKAVENKNYELVEWLIEEFGYFEQQIGMMGRWSWEVMNPYFMACINNDLQMAQYLKSKGADPNIILPTGKNHLTLLASSIDSPQLMYQVMVVGNGYAYVKKDNDLLFSTLKVFFSTGADPYHLDNNGVSFVTHPNIVKNPEVLNFVKLYFK